MKQTDETCRISAEAISNIDFLMGRDEFTSILEYFKERADELANAVLHNPDLTDMERERLRNYRLGIMEFLKYPEEQRQAHVRILTMSGRIPGDGIEVGL